MNKPVFITILFLFGIFLVLYITQATGYYEYQTNKKTVLTEQAIEKFEKDLEEGKTINVNDYVVEEKDNSNKISRATLNISKSLEKGVNKIIKSFFRSVSKIIEE